MSQTFSKKKLQVANSTLVNFFEMKKISFQKKIQVWAQSTNQIPHLYFFFEMKIFSFQKNLQVLNLPLVIFFRKSLGHSQIQKKSRQK